MPATTKPITYEESLKMPENRLEEIIDGASCITPPAPTGHWELLSHLRDVLEEQLPRRAYRFSSGEAGLGIRRNPVFTYRVPDLAVFSRAALAQNKDPAYVWVAPVLIVECLSPANRRGRIERLRQHYESICVPELWLVDPHKRVLSLYLLEAGLLRHADAIERGTIFPSRLPGVGVDLGELWETFNS
ncbi:MAG: Uma2 family endonuclease [Acidobacteriota bacterium]|nr:Uma2 family endonuclease [Acidobacteriota bacterium]